MTPPLSVQSLPREKVGVTLREAGHEREAGTKGAVATSSSPLSFACFCLLTFVIVGRPQDYLPALASLRPALVLTVLTCALTVSQGTGHSGIWRLPETRLYWLFVAIVCIGTPFSIYRRASFEFVVFGYLANALFYLLFLAHVRSLPRLRLVISVVTLSALAFNLVWMKQGGFTQGRYSGGSGMFDPNDIAFIEVSLMSLALAVVVGGYRIVLKALALAALLMSVLLALYSASRGGAIALAAWLLLFLGLPIVKISGLRKVAVIGVAAVLVSANADKINIERLSTLMNLQDDYNMSAEGGRTDIWKRGLGELRQRPLTGVGVACFGEAVGLARERDGELGRRQTAHNSYVQVATETGVIGGLLFLLLIGTCLFNFNRLRKKKNNTIPELAGHSALFLVGFVALSTAAFFLSQGYSVFFILYFALSGCLRIIVRDTACGGDEGATDRAAQTALGSS